jgi:hypothetical protein
MQAILFAVTVVALLISAVMFTRRKRTAKQLRENREEANMFIRAESRILHNEELSRNEKAILVTKAAKNFGIPRAIQTKRAFTNRLAHKYAILLANSRKSRK